MSFQKVLAKYRAISFFEKDKGARFERLMQVFLKTAPWYEGKIFASLALERISLFFSTMERRKYFSGFKESSGLTYLWIIAA